MTIISYLIVIIFNQRIEKNDASERGCQTDQNVLFDLCVTRWVENLDGYSMFLVTLPFIVGTLEVTGHKLHMEKYQEWKERDIESRWRAASLLGIFS